MAHAHFCQKRIYYPYEDGHMSHCFSGAMHGHYGNTVIRWRCVRRW